MGNYFSFTRSETGCSPLSALGSRVYWGNVELVAAGGGLLSGERPIGSIRDPFRDT
jgi:hypothetical protein